MDSKLEDFQEECTHIACILLREPSGRHTTGAHAKPTKFPGVSKAKAYDRMP